ncbi:MAG: metallophosphoesterase [Thermomicrobium sp.]|nr:metallophosphoesterase [Thermomicrobium sp.]
MFFKKASKRVFRLFFATDIHGSDVCWRKFLNAAHHYQADVLVLGGDLTGKAIVPIVQEEKTRWSVRFLDADYELHSESEVRDLERVIADRGYYPVVLTREALESMLNDSTSQSALFQRLMLERVDRWMQLADERLASAGLTCYVCPGNDDPFEIDERIARAKSVQLAEGRVIELFGYQMASTGWSNRTPWHTYREEDEDALYGRIQLMVQQLRVPPERVILNLHCPPFASGLDDAPEIGEDLRVRYAGRATRPVGSRAVRRVIEELQPIVSLHGHIHEGRGTTRIGRTLCINPGSSYEQGQLLGAVIDFDGSSRLSRYLLTVG